MRSELHWICEWTSWCFRRRRCQLTETTAPTCRRSLSTIPSLQQPARPTPARYTHTNTQTQRCLCNERSELESSQIYTSSSSFSSSSVAFQSSLHQLFFCHNQNTTDSSRDWSFSLWTLFLLNDQISYLRVLQASTSWLMLLPPQQPNKTTTRLSFPNFFFTEMWLIIPSSKLQNYDNVHTLSNPLGINLQR